MIIQIKEIVALVVMGVQYFVHWTNLAMMMVLSNFNSIFWLKVLLQLMHAFFSHSLKKHLEFQKLCEVFTKRKKKGVHECEANG